MLTYSVYSVYTLIVYMYMVYVAVLIYIQCTVTLSYIIVSLLLIVHAYIVRTCVKLQVSVMHITSSLFTSMYSVCTKQVLMKSQMQIKQPFQQNCDIAQKLHAYKMCIGMSLTQSEA